MDNISNISWNNHVWKVVEKFVEKCGYVDINYFIWKIVILLVDRYNYTMI